MSLSWRDRLHIALTPTRVVLVRLGRGFKPRVADKAVLACPAPESPGDWLPAVETLRQALAGRQWRHAAARVILSNHFVRYLLVDWDESLSTPEEQAALVQYRFTQTYGEAAADWTYRWQVGRPPAPCLACAIDPALLAGLQQLFADSGLHTRLAGIQPYLMAAFNHWRREIDGRGDWFLLAEPGRLVLTWYSDDEWAGLHSQQIGPEWGGDLARIIDRVQLVSGQPDAPARVCIHAPGMAPSAMVLPTGWSGNLLRLPPLPGFSPETDMACAMALAA